jgi:hypothetical protein
MAERTQRLSRRNFLMAAGVGGAVTAAAIIARTSSAPLPGKDTGKRFSRGYQASAHVNNYYRTTKV